MRINSVFFIYLIILIVYLQVVPFMMVIMYHEHERKKNKLFIKVKTQPFERALRRQDLLNC